MALEDLTARHARLCWDLAENKPVAPKFARDLLRMMEVVPIEAVEPVWRDHRKPNGPDSFAKIACELHRLIASRPQLLEATKYPTDISELCPRCRPTPSLPIAEASRIFSLLGYC